MGKGRLSGFLLATVATAASASSSPCISTVSWADPRVDLFGVAADSSIWHKFFTGWDWQPASKFERLPSETKGCPSVSSWGEGRFDIVYINGSGSNVLHKYYGGNSWGPSWEGAEDLGGFVDAVASSSWGDNRLDIVAKTKKGSYLHKAWTGDGWFPSHMKWEDFGGEFFSDPAIVTGWGPGRIDIIGLNSENASLSHKYYQDSWSEWEDLGGGPFIGNPVATATPEGRLDFWAIDSDGVLNHMFWNGDEYTAWEQLGGEFTDTPKVIQWGQAGKITIVGKSLSDEMYHMKHWDGHQWNPEGEDWYALSGPYESEPGLLGKHLSDFYYVFGITEAEELRMQIWTGWDWQPAASDTWPIGSLKDPYAESRSRGDYYGQSVLGMSELK